MFFILSKILLFLLYPFTWIVGLLFIALFIKRPRLRKVCIVISACLLLIFSNSFVLNTFFKVWEIKYIPLENYKKNYGYAILLAGSAGYEKTTDRIIFSESSDRILQTIDLYHSKRISKIYLVGGSGSLIDQSRKESAYVHEFLLKTGIPDSNIIVESQSRNTYENAISALKLIPADTLMKHGALLITSSFHMRRAMGCFRKAGLINFDVFPTDAMALYSYEKVSPMFYIVPSAKALWKWNILIKEWVGFEMYKFAAYI